MCTEKSRTMNKMNRNENYTLLLLIKIGLLVAFRIHVI